MSLYAIHIANGRTANTSPLRLLGRLLSGTGVIESTAFTVSAQGTPDMTVKVSGSTTSDNLVIITTGGDTYHGWNTANANVTISSNATGVSKRDAVVAYVDTALITTTPDNPGGLVLTTVRGSGTDTVPSDAEIDASVSSKPWIRLANIFVANGASSINSGNITDTRTFATVDGKYLKAASVPNAAFADGSLGFAKLDASAWIDGSSLALTGWSGTPTKSIAYVKLGRLVILRFQISGTSNSTLARIALPFNGTAAVAQAGALGDARDNSVELTVATRWVIDGPGLPGSLQFFPTMGGGNWTASGTKAMYGVAIYEAAS